MISNTNTPEQPAIPEDIARFIKRISSGYGGDCYIIAACEKLYRHLRRESINDSWISVDTPPEFIADQNYSERVFVISEGKVEIMAHCWINNGEAAGKVWCNCYGDINGDPQFDADYSPTHWRPIPKLPTK